MSLADILLKQGLLNQAALDAIPANERGNAARLARYLVENRVLTSDEVALGLAEQLRVAPALDADFVRADPALRKRVLVHQAIEMQAIPLFHTGPRRVAVAMANPANAAVLDRLAFMLGATVDPMVAGEVALARQFELLYKVRQRRRPSTKVKDLPIPNQAAGPATKRDACPAETASEIRPALRSHCQPTPSDKRPPSGSSKSPTGERSRAEPACGHAAAEELPPAVVPAAPPLRLAPLDPLSAASDPAAPVAVMEDAVCFTPTPMTFIPPRLCDPPAPSRVLSRHTLTPVVVPITATGAQLAVDQIRFATDQQDLSDNLFTFMRSCFAVGAMFLVTGAVAQGRFGFAGGQVRPGVESLRFSLSLPSCLRIARSRRGTFRGAPPPDGMAVHGPLWAALETDPPSDVLVAPVIVDGQVTLLLYAQGALGGHVSGLAAGKIEQVREALSSSLLRLAV